MDPSGQEIDSPLRSLRALEPERRNLIRLGSESRMTWTRSNRAGTRWTSSRNTVRRCRSAAPSSASKLVPVGRRTCEVDRDVRGAGL